MTEQLMGETTAELGAMPPELVACPEWQLACRVAASPAFSKSELLRQFLLFVCEEHLMGRGEAINEQQIGVRAFHRPPGYNPSEDNIVRSYARQLRQRLEEYFESNPEEPLRLEIPRGGYVPRFYRVTSPVEEAEIATPERQMPVSAPESERRGSYIWIGLAIGLLAGLLGGVGVTLLWLHHAKASSLSAAHPIWNAIFENNRNTVILSTDSGLGVLENLTHHPVSLEEYANGSYLSDLKPPAGMDEGNLNDLRRQRYTSYVDLNVISQITSIPEYIANRSQIRYARGISTEDLRGSNAILLGSKHTDPWVALFEGQMNFRLEFTPEVDRSYVVNENPLPGEQKSYENGRDAADNRTYGTIDFLPSLDGKGHVLILQGLNMASTQAASDVMFKPEAMRSVIQQAMRPDGSLRSFELLIETRSIGANAPNARILATRFY